MKARQTIKAGLYRMARLQAPTVATFSHYGRGAVTRAAVVFVPLGKEG